ncbi:galactose mutarotase, partial [Xanthomonas sp. Kuri4-1]
RRAWTVRASAPSSLRLGYRSPAGEEGYPGTLEVEAEFRLDGRRLTLVYTAHSDAPTPLNLTHHPYFNLAGDPAVAAAAQVLRVPADRYLPVDAELIPTGEIAATAGTPFDFRAPASLQERAGPWHPQLESAGGYDTCLVLAETRTCSAELYSPHSGVALRLSSAMPAVQLYEGQGLDRHHPGLGRGVCLEPQAYPDAPNQPRFPETILRPGQVHTHRIDYLFAEAGRDAPWAQVAAALDAESAGAA